MATNEESMTKLALFQKQQNIFRIAKAFWFSVEQDWHQQLKDFDLTINEYMILVVLFEENHLTISEIAAQGFMHISTAMNLCRRMAQKELLFLEKNEHDKRITVVELKEKGRKLVEQVHQELDFSEAVIEKSTKKIEHMIGIQPTFNDLRSVIRDVYGKKF
ncbi:transcriptional regulator, SarA/Rot family [Isobaculum melis]|uniref:Transcriptional regulator, MarR family n=1 Tax=Isobaculum melis TaxID=142588 RepID=A0A1H9TCK6_9LACT|nr:MarR family transcriptional regulator [Isobaculum melis]SER94952.1 transcriptional regulator, MarR family [Isobaculum melis]